jgi:hypothetical protein
VGDANRVTLNHARTVLGLTQKQTLRALRRVAGIYPRGGDGKYDARALDLVRAMRGQAHRALEPVDDDWLARYMEETRHAPQGTQEPGPADA